MSGSHRTVVKAIQQCGRDVVQLSLARPSGYDFAPGQWFRLTLQTSEGSQTKTFSHSSAPSTPDLEMATRVSGSAFKMTLASLRAGDEVGLTGPGGRLRLPEGASRVVFLTGGVGVTPVRSLLLDAAARRAVFEEAIVLFGNRDSECAPYLDDLLALSSTGVGVVPVYENPPEGWNGEGGFITASMVARHVDVDRAQMFVVTGPPAMVNAMDAVLDELGVEGERRLVERFNA